MGEYEIVDPNELLKALRWCEDMIVVSPDTGERVWLKRVPGGLSDCCDAAYPCEYHARLTNQALRQPAN